MERERVESRDRVGRGGASRRAARAAIGAIAVASAFMGLGAPLRAQVASAGWKIESSPVASPSAAIGGFEQLADGNFALYDGASIVELDRGDLSIVRTIWTAPWFMWGSFLRLAPDGATLWFGESSTNSVWTIDVGSGNGQQVAQVKFPFDLAFDAQGRAFVTYALGFFVGSHVALIDPASGALDDVVDSPDASGPIAFDRDGNLLVATPDGSRWPPARDATEIVRVAAADVDAAIGPGAYDVANGEVLAHLDGAYALSIDDAGDLLVTDANYGTIVDVDPATGAETTLASTVDGSVFLFASFATGTRGAFEPFQPEEGGTLRAVRSDFFSLNELATLRPARPALSTSPASPIPVGSFDVELTNGPANGYALLLLSDALLADELELRNRSWPAPLFFGLDGAGLVALPIALDGAGEWRDTFDNTGYGGVTVAAQVLVGATSVGPFYGTSAPIAVVLE